MRDVAFCGYGVAYQVNEVSEGWPLGLIDVSDQCVCVCVCVCVN